MDRIRIANELVKIAKSLVAKTVTKRYGVVGVTFENRQPLLKSFFENEYKNGERGAFLECEPNNKYDNNAVAVFLYINGKKEKVGYIDRNYNANLVQDFKKITKIAISSMGAANNGSIGFSINVTFDTNKQPFGQKNETSLQEVKDIVKRSNELQEEINKLHDLQKKLLERRQSDDILAELAKSNFADISEEAEAHLQHDTENILLSDYE